MCKYDKQFGSSDSLDFDLVHKAVEADDSQRVRKREMERQGEVEGGLPDPLMQHTFIENINTQQKQEIFLQFLQVFFSFFLFLFSSFVLVVYFQADFRSSLALLSAKSTPE